MKFLFILILLTLAAQSFACIDTTGTYKNNISNEVVKIVQTGCNEIYIKNASFTATVPLGDQFTQLGTDKRTTAFIKVILSDTSLIITTKLEINDPKVILKDNFATETICETDFDPSGALNLTQTLYNQHGVIFQKNFSTLTKISN